MSIWKALTAAKEGVARSISEQIYFEVDRTTPDPSFATFAKGNAA